MKPYILFCITILFVNQLKAEYVSGYFINKKGDTIQAEFRMAQSRSGSFNTKKIRRSIKYSVIGGYMKTLNPSEVIYVRVDDSSFGSYEVFPLHLEKKWIFALCVVNGHLQVFKSERDNAAWILNKYSSPTELTYYIKLRGKPLASSSITPFNNKFWIQYLGKEFYEFTECLHWERKKRRQMRKEGKPCQWEGKSFIKMAQIFNEEYP